MSYTQEQKVEMYRKGEYVMSVPSVTTGQWDEASWIKWVDGCNGWRPHAKSFKAEVQTAGNGDNWSSNAVRLPTHEQALAYGTDLQWRWTAVRALRVVESDDPPNYQWVEGSLKPYSVLAQSMLLDTQKGGA